MGQPLSLSLTPVLYVNGAPMAPSQISKQVKSDIPQDNPIQVDWIPQDPSKRTTKALLGDLNDRAAMLQTSNDSSQYVQLQLGTTRSQYQASSNQFQSHTTTYHQAKKQENQSNVSLANRLESSGFTLAVYRPQEDTTANKVDVAWWSKAPSISTPDATFVETHVPYPVSAKTRKEQKEAEIKYYAGYIPESMNRIEGPKGAIPLVFDYKKDLKIQLPFTEPSKRPGFLSSGTLLEMHDREAQISFMKGNYVHCPNLMKIQEENGRIRKVDVILTGIGPGGCGEFQQHLATDVAYLHAGNQLNLTNGPDPKLPYGDTPVIHYENEKLKPIGTVANMSEKTKRQIIHYDFVTCSTFTQAKTDPRKEFEFVGTVVTGTTDPKVCEVLQAQEDRAQKSKAPVK